MAFNLKIRYADDTEDVFTDIENIDPTDPDVWVVNFNPHTGETPTPPFRDPVEIDRTRIKLILPPPPPPL